MTTFSNPSDDALRGLLSRATTVAIVGASSNPERPSHGIMQKLLSVGYRVVPINPNEAEILGQKAYASLDQVPGPVDIVDVFRKPADVPAIADAAVGIGAGALWLQPGAANDEAAARASAAGLTVIQDLCIGATHTLLGVPRKAPVAGSPSA